ncbi:MAG: hypothetical protein DSY82_06765 [Flavobacteriia bacterium]|nr:MAG: hypothetical protein DSY82_06765 [Flavobacteriia bacterium]
MWDKINIDCISGFTICPPKPCNAECKDLDVYVEKTECIYDERSQQYTGYNVNIDISGIDDTEQKACISYALTDNPGQSIQWGSLSNGSWTVGPFDSDIYLTVTVCPKYEDCPCSNSTCYKTIYIPKPDCETQKGIEKGGIGYRSGNAKIVVENTDAGELTVIPNPFNNDEIILHSTLKHTVYEIFDLSGKKIQDGDFEGIESKVKIVVSPGIYFIRYIDKARKSAIVKIIKL